MAKNKTKAISNILDNFNFIKVHKTMEFLNWGWAEYDGLEVPPISRLVTKAWSMLDDVYDLASREKVTCHISTGGLKVTAHVDLDTKEIYNLELMFVLTDWDADIEVDQRYL